MTSEDVDPTRRFSDRVEHYARYRPSYPEGVLDVLREHTGLSPGSVVADSARERGSPPSFSTKRQPGLRGCPRAQPMLEALDAIFEQHATAGRVAIEYRTEIYFGRLREESNTLETGDRRTGD